MIVTSASADRVLVPPREWKVQYWNCAWLRH